MGVVPSNTPSEVGQALDRHEIMLRDMDELLERIRVLLGVPNRSATDDSAGQPGSGPSGSGGPVNDPVVLPKPANLAPPGVGIYVEGATLEAAGLTSSNFKGLVKQRFALEDHTHRSIWIVESEAALLALDTPEVVTQYGDRAYVVADINNPSGTDGVFVKMASGWERLTIFEVAAEADLATLDGSGVTRVGDRAYVSGTDANYVKVSDGWDRVAQPATTAPPAVGTASVGTSPDFARADHTHEGPQPSDVAPPAVGTGSAGVSDDYARADHTHDGGGGASLSDATPQAVSLATGSAGTSADASRADHVHQIPFLSESGGKGFWTIGGTAYCVTHMDP